MINWIALLVGVVAAFAVGFLIYGPFLGLQKRWAEGTRISPEPPEKMPVGAMMVQLLALGLLALVVAITETTQSLGLAMLAILLFAAQAASVGAWAQKTPFAIAVDTGYAVLAGVVLIAAHAIL